ncbi:MAG: AsmA family protein [Candidatus Omnitrophica bacterium]|nr:AsmA family protein [Candidatus Omnitrophota bacterium]
MKALKSLFLGLALLILIIAVALAVFIATFDINQYKSRLTQTISSLLGRQVEAGRLKLSFALDKGLTFVIEKLSMADNPSFGREAFLAADSVYLNVDILKFILQKEIIISKIEIRSPDVRIVRNPEGLLNVQTMLPTEKPQGLPVTDQATVVPSPTVVSKVKILPVPPMTVDTITIVDGLLTYIDRASDPALIVPLRRINVKITDLSLQNRAFSFRADAALWADQPNLHGQGEMAIDLNSNKIQLDRGRLETDLSQVQLPGTPFYPDLKEKILLEGDLTGKIVLDDIRLAAGQEGLQIYSLRGTLSGGRAMFEFLNKPVEDIHADLQMNENSVDLKEAGFSYASGTVSAHGRLSDYGKSNMFMLDCQAADMRVAELVPQEKMPVWDAGRGPVRLEGRVYGNFNLEGQGEQFAQLQESFKGDGTLDIREAKLMNINLLRFILEKISFLPDLAQKIEANLSPEYKDKLEGGDTPLDQVTLKADIHDQAAVLTLDVGAAAFSLKANGRIGLDQNLALTADFYIPEDLSNSMAIAVEELGYFKDQDGRIHIPFKPYEGKWQEVRIYPDIGRLSKQVIRNKGQEELRKAIFRVLNVEDTPATPAPEQEGQQPSAPSPQSGGENTEPQPSPEGKVILDSILDTIFKGK